MKNIKVVILYSLTLFISIIYSLDKGWLSSTILWLILSVSTVYYLRGKFKSNSKQVTELFLISFCFYSIYMFATNYLFVENPENSFFIAVDSIKFWNNSNFKMEQISDILKTYSETSFATQNYRFFNFSNLLVSFFGQIFDQNNILIQKLPGVFLSALSIPFIYMIFVKYFNESKAYNYTFIFLIFSYALSYSAVYFRDSFIYFFYTVGIYLLIYYSKERFVFIKLILVLIILLGLRTEHGLFFSIFLLSFFYLKSKKNKIFVLVAIFILPILISLYLPVVLNSYKENVSVYADKVVEANSNTNSVGAQLLKLPSGIKQILMAVNGQLAPAIPFWRTWSAKNISHVYSNVEGYYTPWRFMESVSAVFSLCVWIIIIIGYRFKKYKHTPRELILLFVIAVLLLLSASTVVNPRRVYGVYLIFYLLAVFAYEQFKRKDRVKINHLVFFSLSSIYICLLII